MGNGEQQPKLVPESDLLAVKAAAKKEADVLLAQLNEAKLKADEYYNSLLSEQAAKQALAAELEELKKEVEQLRPLSEAKKQAEKRISELETLLLDATKQRIIQVYKVPEDKLQGKTLAELNAIEEALKLVGREAGRFDTTGAGIGVGAELSPREKIKQGLEQISRR